MNEQASNKALLTTTDWGPDAVGGRRRLPRAALGSGVQGTRENREKIINNIVFHHAKCVQGLPFLMRR